MAPARRTALISVAAAAFLVALKLVVGLLTNSLGLLSEALHSGTDLVAALLTFFAIGVAHRPADATHAFGHGKAEHLSALAECTVLALASVVIGVAAVRRLSDDAPPHVETAWWVFATLGIVIAVDVTRAVLSHRAARRFGSAALSANALHFVGDMLGTLAVIVGLVLVRAGITSADAVAALFVAVLVLVAATRLARVNVHVLMDSTPLEAERTARGAVAALGPDITLERLRMREAAGRQFTDVVISVAPSAALAEGHAAADAVEEAIRRDLPEADVVVHVEPGVAAETDLREQALAAALAVPGVREIHNVRVFEGADGATVSLHLKLPARTRLADAHLVADTVETSIRERCPGVGRVATHLEPLADPTTARPPDDDATVRFQTDIARIVSEITGRAPIDQRFAHTDDGLVAFVVIAVAADATLAAAHEVGGIVRRRLRQEIAELDDALIHTEPAPAGPAGQ